MTDFSYILGLVVDWKYLCYIKKQWVMLMYNLYIYRVAGLYPDDMNI